MGQATNKGSEGRSTSGSSSVGGTVTDELTRLRGLSLYSEEVMVHTLTKPSRGKVEALLRETAGHLGEGVVDTDNFRAFVDSAHHALMGLDDGELQTVTKYIGAVNTRLTQQPPGNVVAAREGEGPVTIEVLSADMLSHIAQFLHEPRDLCRLGRTCKAFYVVASQSTAWERICLRMAPSFWDWSRCRYRSDLPSDSWDFTYEMFLPANAIAITDWRQAYISFVTRKLCCVGQVIEKHRREGVRQSAYDAVCTLKKTVPRQPKGGPAPDGLVRYPRRLFHCEYYRRNEPREVFYPEVLGEERIRPVPADVRDLDPYGLYWPEGVTVQDAAKLVGQDVEIQFHFRGYDVWGWWRGVVSSVDIVEESIRVHFTQFNPASPWAYEVVLRNRRNERGAQGQGVGGFRICTKEEARVWKYWYDEWEMSRNRHPVTTAIGSDASDDDDDDDADTDEFEFEEE